MAEETHRWRYKYQIAGAAQENGIAESTQSVFPLGDVFCSLKEQFSTTDIDILDIQKEEDLTLES